MCAGTHSAQNVRRNAFMLLEMCAEAYLCFSRCAQKHIYAARDVRRSTFMLLEMCADTHVWCEIPGTLIKQLNTSSGNNFNANVQRPLSQHFTHARHRSCDTYMQFIIIVHSMLIWQYAFCNMH